MKKLIYKLLSICLAILGLSACAEKKQITDNLNEGQFEKKEKIGRAELLYGGPNVRYNKHSQENDTLQITEEQEK